MDADGQARNPQSGGRPDTSHGVGLEYTIVAVTCFFSQ